MPTDSSGNYSPPASYFVQNGDTVLPVQHNPVIEDLGAGLTNRLMKDGRTVWTGDMKAGGYRVTGAGAGQDQNDVATIRQVGRKASFDTVADLLADTSLFYGPGSGAVQVSEGDIIEAQGFRYEVAASDAVDEHLTTAGGVKLLNLSGNLPRSLHAFEFPHDALVAKTANTFAQIIPIGDHTLDQGVDWSAYQYVKGFGDQSRLIVPPGGTGFKHVSQTGVWDDHPHNFLKEFRISGDAAFASYPGAGGTGGTTIGASIGTVVQNTASLASAQGMTFELHDIGRYVRQSYTHFNAYNNYRGNSIGLKLENVTSWTEVSSYFRNNSEAAIQIIGGQNVTFRGGAIEGNRGIGLEFIPDLTRIWGQLNLDDVYFESNGDQAAGVWSIDVPFGSNTMVNVKGGNYWTNSAGGITSGPYRFGDTVAFDGATMNGAMYAKEVVGYKNVRGPGIGRWNSMSTESLTRQFGLMEPAVFHEFKPAAYNRTFDAVDNAGSVIATKVIGRGASKMPGSPNIGTLTFPYNFSSSGGATQSENSGLDYGDGSFVKVQFGASVGNFSSNYATMMTFPDTTKPFRVFCCLIRPDQNCELGFLQSVGGQSLNAWHSFQANKMYRLVFLAQAPMTAGSLLRVFPLDTTAPAVNFLPIWASQHPDYLSQLKVAELLVEGVL